MRVSRHVGATYLKSTERVKRTNYESETQLLYYVILLWCVFGELMLVASEGLGIFWAPHTVPLFHHIHLVINTHTHKCKQNTHRQKAFTHPSTSPMSSLVCEWGIVGERQRCWRALVQICLSLSHLHRYDHKQLTHSVIEYCVFCSLCANARSLTLQTSPHWQIQEIDLLCVRTLSAQVCV